MMRETFSVHQFFIDGSSECVREGVGAREAVDAAKHYTESVGAKMGTTVRVIITDGWDCCNFEWKNGQGVTYPPRNEAGRFICEPGNEAP